MDNVFNFTDLQTRLSDLHSSGSKDYDKSTLKNLNDLDIVDYAFPGRIDKYLDDVVNPYIFKVDNVTVKMEFNCDGQSLSDSLVSAIKFH